MNLDVLDEINPEKAASVARELGVSKDVFIGWLIDGRIRWSYIVKMAQMFGKPPEYYVIGPYEPPRYKRNRQKWERPDS